MVVNGFISYCLHNLVLHFVAAMHILIPFSLFSFDALTLMEQSVTPASHILSISRNLLTRNLSDPT